MSKFRIMGRDKEITDVEAHTCEFIDGFFVLSDKKGTLVLAGALIDIRSLLGPDMSHKIETIHRETPGLKSNHELLEE